MTQDFNMPDANGPQDGSKPVMRFAPSPNGRLHLGHAYSALLNQKIAREIGATLRLRVENTDLIRSTPVLEQRMLEDLEWIGFKWDGAVYRQSDHLENYAAAIEILRQSGLAYPAFMSRKEVQHFVERETELGNSWPVDPDGAPHYPPNDRLMGKDLRQTFIDQGKPHSIRLDMEAAAQRCGEELTWHEEGSGPEGESHIVAVDPLKWGDIVLSRKDSPASYHLASVVDDALMGVTHIVRGRDLFWSTSAHRLLQTLFGYAEPNYFHHDLILDFDGRKLSKSRNDTSLAELRASGATPNDIRKMIGLED
ncbi:MAG: tRNA glutamyl-Q(34) synthetase GluQRS [Salaquimonas sp.]